MILNTTSICNILILITVSFARGRILTYEILPILKEVEVSRTTQNFFNLNVESINNLVDLIFDLSFFGLQISKFVKCGEEKDSKNAKSDINKAEPHCVILPIAKYAQIVKFIEESMGDMSEAAENSQISEEEKTTSLKKESQRGRETGETLSPKKCQSKCTDYVYDYTKLGSTASNSKGMNSASMKECSDCNATEGSEGAVGLFRAHEVMETEELLDSDSEEDSDHGNLPESAYELNIMIRKRNLRKKKGGMSL